MAIIRLMLDISTAHLPEKYGDESSPEALDKIQELVVDTTDAGFLMWVPSDPTEYQFGNRVPEEILKIQQYARMLGCDYVRFDRDADIVDGLDAWEW